MPLEIDQGIQNYILKNDIDMVLEEDTIKVYDIDNILTYEITLEQLKKFQMTDLFSILYRCVYSYDVTVFKFILDHIHMCEPDELFQKIWCIYILEHCFIHKRTELLKLLTGRIYVCKKVSLLMVDALNNDYYEGVQIVIRTGNYLYSKKFIRELVEYMKKSGNYELIQDIIDSLKEQEQTFKDQIFSNLMLDACSQDKTQLLDLIIDHCDNLNYNGDIFILTALENNHIHIVFRLLKHPNYIISNAFFVFILRVASYQEYLNIIMEKVNYDGNKIIDLSQGYNINKFVELEDKGFLNIINIIPR